MGPKLLLLLGNLNRSREAQDFFLHTLAESGSSIGIASETHRIPANHPCWASDAGDSVAITWRWWHGASVCSTIESGRRYVRWGPIAVIHFLPSQPLFRYEKWLGRVERCVRCLHLSPVIVAGDFNTWSTAWGSRRTNARGEAVKEWAAGLGLALMNRGRVNTCVRRQGASIVDLTWVTPSACRLITKWEVDQGREHLSDHRYVWTEFATPTTGCRPGGPLAAMGPWQIERGRVHGHRHLGFVE